MLFQPIALDEQAKDLLRAERYEQALNLAAVCAADGAPWAETAFAETALLLLHGRLLAFSAAHTPLILVSPIPPATHTPFTLVFCIALDPSVVQNPPDSTVVSVTPLDSHLAHIPLSHSVTHTHIHTVTWKP